MVSTLDNAKLNINDIYFVVEFDDNDKYVVKLIPCTYKGFYAQAIDGLSSNCSGCFIPPPSGWGQHVFCSFVDNKELEVSPTFVKSNVIKDLSCIESATVMKIKN